MRRLTLTIRGLVQGVGFRPFVYRLAQARKLSGWVLNTSSGVQIEAEGPLVELERFRVELQAELPPRALIHSIKHRFDEATGVAGFQICESAGDGARHVWLMPDIAICAACTGEMLDPRNRRFRHPFTNCTNCGPRYSIMTGVPYDRANTTMRRFAMCADCRREYENPDDRRFHAQPNACPICGPQLELLDQDGRRVALRDHALREAIEALAGGRIVACKGVGGFHLLANARDERAVAALRARKRREEKPFAVMVADLASARELCEIDAVEAELFESPVAPIVLMLRKQGAVCEAVSPGNPRLGVMCAYTPLHQLMLRDLGVPLVATSGNRSDELICCDNDEALCRLKGVADLFLMHDRPIAQRVDDSVVHVVAEMPQVLRRARGYAPLPVTLKNPAQPVLAVGGHQKNTTAIMVGADVFLSPHIGDLDGPESHEAFLQSIDTLQQLHGVRAERIACDLHPDYRSTQFAQKSGRAVTSVQHHFAHALACMADNELDGPVLAVVWDGTGYGADGTIWGGEFLRVDGTHFERVDHLRAFRLPGGEAAMREPRRSALGVLFEAFGADPPILPGISRREAGLMWTMARKQINSPLTSSAGRLFDAVAAILGLRQRCSFEGQAAMELEFSVVPGGGAYECPSTDWTPLIRQAVADVQAGVPSGVIAGRFHDSLVAMIVGVAGRVGEPRVVLSGGCFQNKYLTERTIAGLRGAGFDVYWHKRVPPNDGGIALGQVVAAARE